MLPHACAQVAGAGHTRLCVKGLPKHLTNERLRKHFEDVAEVTDARVCTRSDGASRNFGFVGFRTEKDAQKCLKYFHDTFIDTSKIICEIARPKGDENLARPWSRYSEGSSAHQRITKKDENKAEVASRPGKGAAKPGTAASAKEKKIASKDHELLERAKTDPKMKAFIDAFKPRTKTKVWENDDAVLNDANAVALKEMTQVPVRSAQRPPRRRMHARATVRARVLLLAQCAGLLRMRQSVVRRMARARPLLTRSSVCAPRWRPPPPLPLPQIAQSWR